MTKHEGYAAKILNDADALLSKVQGDLDAAADFYRSNEINPDKVLSAVAPHLGAQEKQQLEKLMAEDQEAIQREVDEGRARLSFSSAPAAGGTKKPRSLV